MPGGADPAARTRGHAPARAAALACVLCTIGCNGTRPPPSGHVIEIDIDDHGLAGLWMASAPNIKGLIARGTLAFSRVVVPTHSNQNNMSLLTGQYPDGDDVPANDWLARDNGFVSPVSLAGGSRRGLRALRQEPAAHPRRQRLPRGPRRRWAHGVRRRAAAVRGGRRRRPPVDRGDHARHAARDDDLQTADAEQILHRHSRLPGERRRTATAYDGPPASGETPDPVHAARRRRPRARLLASHPMPAFMFVWDFVALDDDPTSMYGADGPAARADHRGLRRRPRRAARRARRQEAARQHQHPLHARSRQGRHPQPGRARHAGGRSRRPAGARW